MKWKLGLSVVLGMSLGMAASVGGLDLYKLSVSLETDTKPTALFSEKKIS